MNKRRIFIIVVVALAAAAALLRAHPSAPAERDVVALAEPTPAAGRAAPSAQVVVYVAGAVVRSGVYHMSAGARVEAAIRAAGGTTPQADRVAVNLAQPLHDGEEIVVPLRGAEPVSGAAGAGPARCRSPRRRSARSGSRFSDSRARHVDLNRAAVEELETLPGIGPHLAERILVFRERNGPFASLDELGDVNGVSPRLLEEIAPYVTFGR
jgi:competence protein ComEA